MLKNELPKTAKLLKQIQKDLISLDFNNLDYVVKIEELLIQDVSLHVINEIRVFLLKIERLDSDIHDECGENIQEIMEILLNEVYKILD